MSRLTTLGAYRGNDTTLPDFRRETRMNFLKASMVIALTARLGVVKHAMKQNNDLSYWRKAAYTIPP